MAVFGYLRTSTTDQIHGIEAQRTTILAKYPDAEFFVEHASGKSVKKRPVFESLLRRVCDEHAKLVVSKLDRLGRSTKDVLQSVERITACGGSLDIMNLGDTSTPMGRFMLTVMAAFGEMERNLISERTREGLNAARQAGSVLGGSRVAGLKADGTATGTELMKRGRPPRKATDPTRLAVYAQLDQGLTDKQILNLVPTCTPSLLRRIKRERYSAASH